MRQLARSFVLTLTQRLWLGLGVIVVLFAAADLVSLRATRELDATLTGLVARADARAAAAHDMKVNLAEMGRALAGDFERQALGQHVRASQNGFQRALARYQESSAGDESRGLARQAAQGYAAVNTRARELDRLLRERTRRLAELAAHQGTQQALLQAIPRPAITGRDTVPLAVRGVVSDLRSALQPSTELPHSLLRTPPDLVRARLGADQQRLADTLSRYRRVASGVVEREWAGMVERCHAERLARTTAVLDAVQAAQSGLARAQRATAALDALLDDRLQPAAKAELTQALDGASATAHRANALMTHGLLLALLLAVLAAMATSRAVRAPLHALVASTRRFAGGDFAYRVTIDRKDELGTVANAFNDMARTLQATTVSRGYIWRA
jgi:HAMP domain-containing protein